MPADIWREFTGWLTSIATADDPVSRLILSKEMKFIQINITQVYFKLISLKFLEGANTAVYYPVSWKPLN